MSSGPRWNQPLVSLQAIGPQLSNSGVATSLLNPQAKYTFPAGYWDTVGKGLYIIGTAAVSNVATTPGTLTLDVRFGSTVIFNGAAMQMSITAHTSLPLWFEIWLTLRVVGSSAAFIGQGKATSQVLNVTAVADSTTNHSTLMMPNTAPANGTTFDATANQQLDIFGTFSVTTNPTNIVMHQCFAFDVF